MSPDSKPFPIYQLQDAFESFCNGEPAAKPQHRSLYYFLLGYSRRRGNTPRFSLAYEAGMHGSGIGSWATYDAALKALAEWGFIVYTPGANRYKVPVVELTFRNPTDDVLLTYWQSYCLSTSNPTDDVLATQLVTLKEVLNKGSREIEKLESEKTQYQADVAAANAALALAEKKIGEQGSEIEKLKSEIEHYAAELYSDPMPPGPQAESPTTELRTLGGAADVGTRTEPEPVKLTKQRGGQKLKPEPGSANPADYELPEWAGTQFVAEFGGWLATRQSRTDCKPLTAKAVQARLKELAGYDEQFCTGLFRQAEQNPHWQGLTFDNTPHKFTQHVLAIQKLQQDANRINQPERGAKPTEAASYGARALSAQLRAIREERSAQNGSYVNTGAAAGAHVGIGSPVPPGVGAPQS